MYFRYGEKEISYLKQKDLKLGEAIDKIGMIERPVIPDLFTATVNNIIAQQISTPALNTVWKRLEEKTDNNITPESILSMSVQELQSVGISFRKANYIHNFAEKTADKSFLPQRLYDMTDDEAVAYLCTLDGIGKWTAEMLLIFSLQRQNVISYGDLGIRRGMKILYHHKEIDEKKFERYKKRYSPYATVASLYLWEIASGALNKQ